MDSIYVLFIVILKTESLILVFCCHASDMNKADPEKFAEVFFFSNVCPWDTSFAWHRINTSNPNLLLCSPGGCDQWKHMKLLMLSGTPWIAKGLGIYDFSLTLPNFWHKPYHSPIPCKDSAVVLLLSQNTLPESWGVFKTQYRVFRLIIKPHKCLGWKGP